MKIAGLEKVTVTDYPGIVACIVFLQGCNFNCSYCHNSSLIPCVDGSIKEDEIFSYLSKRRNVLDGVVISGGEPLLQVNLKKFIEVVKSLGYRIKLDTNGINTDFLRVLLSANLLDYIAMDIKHDEANYQEITGVKIDFSKIKNSIKLIESSGVDYEFRTTIVKDKFELKSIENICKLLNVKSKYYLQNYIDSNNVLVKGLKGFSKAELIEIETYLKSKYPNLMIRKI